MEVAGWIVDKSAAVRAADPRIADKLQAFGPPLYLCPMGALEQLYSARSAADYEAMKAGIGASFELVQAPPDILERSLQLQLDLARHHGMWHRTPIGDLIIAETALFQSLGVLHVDRDYSRIAEVRPLKVERLE